LDGGFQPLTGYLSLFLLVWIIAYAVSKRFRLERYGLEIKPLVFVFRTKRVEGVLDLLSSKFRRVLPALLNLSLVVSLGMMGLGSYLLARNLYSLLYRVEEAAPVFPAIPLITIRESLPYFLVAVAVLIIVHEGAHGVAARFEGIKVKSAGVLLIAIIPGGFVEPDEEEFRRAKVGSRLRVLAAGSTANMALALLIIPIILGLFHPSGILIGGVLDGSPIQDAGVKPGTVIEYVNDVRVVSLDDFRRQMAEVQVGSEVKLGVRFENGTFKVLTVKTMADPNNPDRAILGITRASNYFHHLPVYLTLFWLHFWSLNIAIFNMLPIYPLDGEGIIYNLAEKFLGRKSRIIRWTLTGFYIALLALNIGLTFGRFGFISV